MPHLPLTIRRALIAILFLVPATPASAQVLTILHNFGGGASDGAHSDGSLVQSGSTLFGMTYYGGSASGNGNGTIFEIGANGTSFGLLRSFSGGPGDGAIPFGSLTISGTTLYGMTQFGGNTGTGSNGLGAVVKVAMDGTGAALVHSFTGAPGDGSSPNGSLVESGGSLYG
ncbi:MAG TPA: choice-of-anchor tandem repeat GloVer-containing protein, partial [Gemmataceae bacterium]|nr:choice-of-anchor tandem repeat GloVer-containing protein [Gemmataceae bacterium]